MRVGLERMSPDLVEDPRFKKAVSLFNLSEWYEAHDSFEELWHETDDPQRRTLQGFLQISVAELHLERGNLVGATILYGEGLGRLRTLGTPDLGFDLDLFCSCIEKRLKLLQLKADLSECTNPVLILKK